MFVFNLKNFIITCIILIGIGILGIVALIQSDRLTKPELVKDIDTIVWGNYNFSVQSEESIDYFLTKDNNEDKDLESIYPLIKQTYIPITRKEDTAEYTFNSPFSQNKQLDLYRSNQQPESLLKMRYNKERSELEFVVNSYSYSLNSKELKTDAVVLYSVKNIQANTVFSISDTVVDLAKYQDNYFFTQKQLEDAGLITVLLPSNDLINKDIGSFESGLWDAEALNCSNLRRSPGQARISSALEKSDVSDGKNALNLVSENHNACTRMNFEIDTPNMAEDIYGFSFDYKNRSGGVVQYTAKLENDQDTKVINDDNEEITEKLGQVYSRFIYPKDNNWHTQQVFMKPSLDGIRRIKISLNSPSDGSNKVDNLYDNVQFKKFKISKEIFKIEKQSSETGTKLKAALDIAKDENPLVFNKNPNNLLAKYNFSFEQGLWSQSVNRCGSIYRGDLSEKDMAIYPEDKIDGKQSLIIVGKNQDSCTWNTFPVGISGDLLYRYSFEYRSLDGNDIRSTLKLRGNDQLSIESNNNGQFVGSARLEEGFVQTLAGNRNWNKLTHVLDTKVGNSDSIEIIMHAYSNDKNPTKNLYDNLSLTELSPKDTDNYYLYNKQNVKENTAVANSYDLNRFASKVRLFNLKENALVYLPEKYNTRWKIYPLEYPKNNDNLSVPIWQTWGKSGISDKFHYNLNNYGNGWLIDVKTLCQDSKFCSKNSDDSYNIDLVIQSDWYNILTISLVLAFALEGIFISLLIIRLE